MCSDAAWWAKQHWISIWENKGYVFTGDSLLPQESIVIPVIYKILILPRDLLQAMCCQEDEQIQGTREPERLGRQVEEFEPLCRDGVGGGHFQIPNISWNIIL